MRKNLPVTQREYPFPRGGTLVSTTDLKGRITYCNPSFIEVSGYAREELLGQAHNLIRHPDMPEEAFRDMWATIQSGKPWLGAVKNRRKNGDFYWVMANVTPLVEGGRPVGYMSVRTEASRDIIDGAEKLYAKMRAEKQAGRRVHALSEGRLETRTILGFLAKWSRLGVGAKIMIATMASACFAVLASRFVPAGLGTYAPLGAAALIGGAIGFAAQRAFTAPLDRIASFANRMAAGDLTQSVREQGSDQIAAIERAQNQLNVNLRAIVRDARNEVEQMRDVMHELASGNQNLATRTESQAGRLEETAASMEEITGNVRQNTESARRASELAAEATHVAERGSDAVAEVSRTMEAIRDSSTRISEVIQVIEGIAFQTNILALNAAVEAARAGEHGRGFAVVASEVRALAQSASTAAKEIAQLILDSTEKVQAGDKATDAARRTMAGALASARDLGHLVSQISAGSGEQLAGISQVHDAINDLDGITQQNAALVEEIAASAVSLEGQADTVVDAVRVFKLEGHAAAPQPDAVELRRRMKQAAYA